MFDDYTPCQQSSIDGFHADLAPSNACEHKYNIRRAPMIFQSRTLFKQPSPELLPDTIVDLALKSVNGTGEVKSMARAG